MLHQYGYDAALFGAEVNLSSPRPFTCVFVGRGQPRQGPHLALDAWHAADLPAEARFQVYSDIDEPYRRLPEPAPAGPGVEVLGPRSDVAAVVRSASALVPPSVEEGSALVSYEARPATSRRLCLTPSAPGCEPGVRGPVHRAGDVRTLTEHLRALAADRGLLDRTRATALDHARSLKWDDAGRGPVGSTTPRSARSRARRSGPSALRRARS